MIFVRRGTTWTYRSTCVQSITEVQQQQKKMLTDETFLMISARYVTCTYIFFLFDTFELLLYC